MGRVHRLAPQGSSREELWYTMLSLCPGLVLLDLSFPESSLSDEAAEHLATALKQQVQLEEIKLRLHGSGIGDVGTSTLLRAIVGLVLIDEGPAVGQP